MLRQRREEPHRELAEIHDVNVPVVVEIEGGDVVGCIEERLREDAEVGDIDVPVAVDVAVEAEQALGVAENEVVAGGAVAVAVELQAAEGNLGG